MSDKSGTLAQCRATEFDCTSPLMISQCPFKGPDLAIVPMRYALDRSRHDPNPDALKPLPASAQWAHLPKLHSRTYTLRQLRDGFVYVFDETANTLHAYRYHAVNAGLERLATTCTTPSPGLPYLLYPRNHVLHIAYATRQWTERLSRQLTSDPASRQRWMKRLDLSRYCITMKEPDTLPLRQISAAVADVDTWPIKPDQRFADCATPSCKPATSPQDDEASSWVELAADAHWLGSVPDKDSALLIALDDPIALLQDLGSQLTADQAAYDEWQTQHLHALQVAENVGELCGLHRPHKSGQAASNGQQDPNASYRCVPTPENTGARLPDWLSSNPALLQRYLIEAEEYLAQYELEERVQSENATTTGTTNLSRERSNALRDALQRSYGVTPSPAEIESWMARSKWRGEVDLPGLRRFQQQHEPLQQRLLQNLQDTRLDIENWADHIGLDALALFIDTTDDQALAYLLGVMQEIVAVMQQDKHAHNWLNEQEERTRSLFSTLRYGFSPAIKDALTREADQLLQGFSDFANLATRAGELNSALNHQDFANSHWHRALDQVSQDTLAALKRLAHGAEQKILQSLMMTFAPSDARLAQGETPGLVALLRTLLITQVLSNTAEGLAINSRFEADLQEWQKTRKQLEAPIAHMSKRWQRPTYRHDRHSMTRELQAMYFRLVAHDMSLPLLMDYKVRQYTRSFKQYMYDFYQAGKNIAREWTERTREWINSHVDFNAGFAWSVVVINLINSAIVLRELGRDGSLSRADLAKVAYNLAYSFNLLMALYLEAPWAVVKNAPAQVINGYSVGILERSSRFWRSQGKVAWADAIGSFRARLLAMGMVGFAGAALELAEIYNETGKTAYAADRGLLWVKFAGTAVMGVVMLTQGLAALATGTSAAAFIGAATGVGAAIVLLVAGLVYLVATMLLNSRKLDAIGLWLRRCRWSYTPENRFPDTPAGHQEELLALLTVQLSPQLLVRRTWSLQPWSYGRINSSRAEQNGAWLQLRLPAELRGASLLFDVISTVQPLGLLPTRKQDTQLQKSFVEQGVYRPQSHWGQVNEQRPGYQGLAHWDQPIPADEAVIWQTWVPLSHEAEYLELQIWYPQDILHPSEQDCGYLFQVELSDSNEQANDGLSHTELQVKNPSRDKAPQIFIMN